MTFERAWVLALVLAPVLWAYFEMRHTPRRIGLALKALALILIILALAGPRISTSERKTAVAVLVDTSASVSTEDLSRASGFVAALEKNRARNWMRVMPFARVTRNADEAESGKGWKLRHTAGLPGLATDIETAIRDAVASMPQGMVPRVVLLSDGKENKGSVARALWQAKQLSIPIDAVPLNGRAQPALHLDSVTLPSLAFAGEKFPIDLTFSAPRPGSGEIEIYAEGKLLAKTPIDFDEGDNRIRAHANVTASGAVHLAVTIRAGNMGEATFDQAVTFRRPRLLYVSGDPETVEGNLLNALSAAQFDVQRAGDLGGSKLDEYQALVLNNQDFENMPGAQKNAVERFVQQGGGLLIIGGEKNVYVEGKQEDALGRTLPAKLAPPRSPEGTCVVLIIDKSSSMEGRKMELARYAAIGVIENLRPVDTVGVLIFDNSFQWAVPLRKAEDRSLIKRLVSGITPDGGTQIAPALSEAYRKILPVKATYKHIVLLTDGISEEGDSLDVSRDALQRRVTISTVGLGQDVNRNYLEKLATVAGGKSYFLNEPTGLEQILLKDVMEHTGSTAVEKNLRAEVIKKAEILDGVGMESAPSLKGYVRYIAKPTAETILQIDGKEPLLTRWQYGLGRAAVFTSDAKSRWASNWVAWPGFDKFWINLMRDLLPHSQQGEATASFDEASGDLVVDYRLAQDSDQPAAVPTVYALGPDNFQQPVQVAKVADGAYRGRVAVDGRQGLFRIRPLVDSKQFPEIGYYRQEQEANDFGSNQFVLRKITEFTGGHFQPEPKQVFDPGRRSVPSTIRLWPGLLVAALLLNLAEVMQRKWPGIFQRTS
jgi:Mg-chelatase subunit ChlD